MTAQVRSKVKRSVGEGQIIISRTPWTWKVRQEHCSSLNRKQLIQKKNCFVNIIFGIHREHNFWCLRDEQAVQFKFSFRPKICRTGELRKNLRFRNIKNNYSTLCEIWGSQWGGYEYHSRLECDVLQFGTHFLKFLKNLLPTSSGSNQKTEAGGSYKS
jgi:hypothetical protein